MTTPIGIAVAARQAASAYSGRSGPSLAGVAATLRLKCGQGLYGVWD
jgi:hypothetical protein